MGYTKNITARVEDLATAMPEWINVVHAVTCETPELAQSLEKSLHSRFKDLRVKGEWFRFDQPIKDYITGQVG